MYGLRSLYFFLIFIQLIFIGVGDIYAQQPTIEYAHKHYTIHDGLAQMQVMSLFQDSKGYLWCQTKAGLSRFDGRSFRNYSKNIPSVLDYGLSPFSETEEHGLLYFGANQIAAFNGDSIFHYNIPEGYLYQGSGKRSGKRHLVLLQASNQLENMLADFSKLDSMELYELDKSKGNIIFYDDEDSFIIWQANEHWINRVNYQTGEVIDSFQNKNNIYKIELFGERRLGFSREGKVFEYNNGVFYLIVDTEQYSYFFKAIPTPDGEALIIKTDKELYLYKNELVLIKDELTYIRDILFDDEGNLWVATEEGLYNFFNLNFVNYKFNKGNKDWVWSVVEDDELNIWFASYQNGIWKWDGRQMHDYTQKASAHMKDDLMGMIKPENNRKIVAEKDIAWWMVIDKLYRYYMGACRWNDKLVFPTERNLLVYEDGRFSSIKNMIVAPYQITKNFNDGELWAGGVPGLYRINNKDDISFWDTKDLNNSSILNIEKDAQGNILTVGKNGISIIKDDQVMKIDTFFARNSFSCTKDHLNNIWVGGEKHISYWNSDSLVRVLSVDEEAFYSLQFVAPNHLLLGGIKGLYLSNLEKYYNEKVFEMVLYNQNNGFTGIECGQNGFYTDSNGDIWIPTSDLVTRFDPQKLIDQKVYPPRIFLNTSVSSDNIEWEPIEESGKRKFRFFNNSFRFKLNTVSFSNYGKVRYFFRLKGLHNDWSGAGENGEIIFYDLKPGNYQFEAYADPGISEAKSGEVNVSFIITPPFWQRWWFIMPVVFLGALLMFLLVQYFRKREQRKYAIERRMVQLKSEALAAQLDPHFVMNCLNNISGLVNTGYAEEANDYIVKFSKLLRVILHSIKKESISLIAELEIVSNYLELEKLRSNNTFSYTIKLPENHSSESIQVPPMLLQPIVENSVKHGFKELKERKGLIEIIFDANNHQLNISIRDNGTGLKKHTPGGLGIGTRVTRERIQLLQQKHQIQFEVKELEQGVEVCFAIPLIDSIEY